MTINTDNYVIRSFCSDDLEELYKVTSDELVEKYVASIYCDNMLDAGFLLHRFMTFCDLERYFYFAICKDDKIIGIIDAEEIYKRSVSIAYVVEKSMRGKGVLVEVLPAFGAWLKENTKIVFMDFIIETENLASRKVVRKLNAKVIATDGTYMHYRIKIR